MNPCFRFSPRVPRPRLGPAPAPATPILVGRPWASLPRLRRDSVPQPIRYRAVRHGVQQASEALAHLQGVQQRPHARARRRRRRRRLRAARLERRGGGRRERGRADSGSANAAEAGGEGRGAAACVAPLEEAAAARGVGRLEECRVGEAGVGRGHSVPQPIRYRGCGERGVLGPARARRRRRGRGGRVVELPAVVREEAEAPARGTRRVPLVRGE